jgi:P4 family phage/plasmid primase-like protien
MKNEIKITELPRIRVETSDDSTPSYKLALSYLYSNKELVYFYNNTFYKRCLDNTKYTKFQNLRELKTDILFYLSETDQHHFMTGKKVNNMITALQGFCFLNTKEKPPFFIQKEISKKFIPLRNGLLSSSDLIAGEEQHFFEHDPDYFSTSCLDFDYTPSATCPTFLKVLEDSIPDRDEQRVIQQWFGYNLIYDNSLERLIIFIGKGRDGKSLLLFILRCLVGEENISTIPLENFGQRFQLNESIGKLSNIVGEISDSSKFPETVIKSFVSGEPFTADIKFQDPVIVYPTARITVAANTFPPFRDTTDGLWRRIIPIPFKRQVPIEEVRPEFMTKDFWYKSGEINGVFNWALEGLRDLSTNGLKVPQSSIKLLEELKSSMNPVETFLQQHIIAEERSESISKEIFEKYQTYCAIHGYKVVSSAIVGREIKKVFPHAAPGGDRYIESYGVRSRLWKNIRLRTKFEMQQEETTATQQSPIESNA